MKTAGEENPNSQVRLYNEPSPWDGKSEPSLLIHRGWKVRKYPAAGGVFFLTFPFIELLGTNLAVAGPDYFRLAAKLPKRWVRL
jgi:hypothetical protein